MLLHVHDNLTIADLQDKFSMCFPGLKIEFCQKKHHWEEICAESQFWPSSTPIEELRKNHSQGVLELKSWYKVGEAEKMFYDQFGLNVQIFYRSGDRWIQTGKSDNLSIGAVQERAYKRPKMVLL
jgi:hypothetical protein